MSQPLFKLPVGRKQKALGDFHFPWLGLLALLTLISCKKFEGEGGLATIQGKIYALDYNSELTLLRAEYYAPEEKVYIVYGDHPIYDDVMDTHFDGSFAFKYLKKGIYTIFAYSKDTTFTVAAETFPVIRQVEITKANQVINLDDLVIVK